MFNRDEIKIPTLDEVWPDLPAARELRQRIHAECRDLKVKAAELRSEISRGQTNDGRNLRVAAILAGEKPAEPVGDMKRLGEMLRRIEDLNAAAEAQSSVIYDLERRASVKLCDSVRDHHNKLASAVCAKLLEVHQLYLRYTELIDAITDRGASTTSLPLLQSPHLEHPEYRDSALGHCLRDAAKQGHMSVKQIPEPLR
jgi:hypothetical protein